MWKKGAQDEVSTASWWCCLVVLWWGCKFAARGCCECLDMSCFSNQNWPCHVMSCHTLQEDRLVYGVVVVWMNEWLSKRCGVIVVVVSAQLLIVTNMIKNVKKNLWSKQRPVATNSDCSAQLYATGLDQFQLQLHGFEGLQRLVLVWLPPKRAKRLDRTGLLNTTSKSCVISDLWNGWFLVL